MMEMALTLTNQKLGNLAQYCHVEINYIYVIHMKQTIFETETFFWMFRNSKKTCPALVIVS